MPVTGARADELAELRAEEPLEARWRSPSTLARWFATAPDEVAGRAAAGKEPVKKTR